MLRKRILKYADHIGITGSVLCLIHCLAVPVIALLSTGAAQAGHYHEVGNDYVFIFICIVAVYFAARSAYHRAVKVSLWFFVALFALGLLVGRNIHELEWLEYLAHTATLGLIITHLVNIRLANRHKTCHVTVQ